MTKDEEINIMREGLKKICAGKPESTDYDYNEDYDDYFEGYQAGYEFGISDQEKIATAILAYIEDQKDG